MSEKRRQQEQAQFVSLPFWGGVDVLQATFVTHSFSRHFHEEYALGCIEDGALEFSYLGRKHLASAGLVNLVVPGEPHDGHGADPAGWSYRMLYLKPEILLEAASACRARPRAPHFRQGVIDDPRLAQSIRCTHAILQRPDVTSLEKETRLLWLLAFWISRHAVERGEFRRTGNETAAVRRVTECIRSGYAEDLGLRELSSIACLSPFHLLRTFQQQTGVTPHEYLTQVRVEQARSMLRGGQRLADIAQTTGFADQSHLTRTFKKRYGVTPGAFRKILQNS